MSYTIKDAFIRAEAMITNDVINDKRIITSYNQEDPLTKEEQREYINQCKKNEPRIPLVIEFRVAGKDDSDCVYAKTNIVNVIGESALLEGCAEEAVELAQACLKLARFKRGENPVCKEEQELINNLAEELADVSVCMTEIIEKAQLVSHESVESIIMSKRQRWYKRLEEK